MHPRCGRSSRKYPTAEEVRNVEARNPEGASPRGKWGDVDFLRNVYDLNKDLKDTQFADYHGHGWNFRGIFKRDRAGNLLDAGGNQATWGTDTAISSHPTIPRSGASSAQATLTPRTGTCASPLRLPTDGKGSSSLRASIRGKTVHMMDIHAEKGHAVRRLPFRAGQPWQWPHLRRGR